MKEFLCGFFTSHKQKQALDGSWPCRCGWAKGNRNVPLAVPAQRTGETRALQAQ